MEYRTTAMTKALLGDSAENNVRNFAINVPTILTKVSPDNAGVAKETQTLMTTP